ENAVSFLNTRVVRTDLGVHNYLPVFTILMAPFGLLPLRVAIVIFTLISLGAFAAAAWMTERSLRRPGEVTPRLATFLSVGLMAPYVTSCAVLGAFGLLLSSLIILAWCLFERRTDWKAGFVIAIAALLKILPGALLVYFALRGRWRVVASAIATLALVGVALPTAILGPSETLRLHQELFASAQRHSARETIFGERPKKIIVSNNALPTTLRRLLTPVDAAPNDDPGHVPFCVNVADWSQQGVWRVYVAIMAIVIISTIALTLAPRGATTTEHARILEQCRFGLWCCLALLATPLMWTHYLPLLYWPLAIACYGAETRRGGFGWIVVLATLVVWLGGAIALASPTARGMGAQIAGVFALWIAMVALSFQATRSPARV
ncbi:MAG: DUF2029 domain-containing protein, partial [Phycisphaerales bacterium]|nr:DUF2029 domain-containing protein [Phycisphaerales bacterium]